MSFLSELVDGFGVASHEIVMGLAQRCDKKGVPVFE